MRHVYEHNLGVVDADAIKKVPDLAAWRGRKYVLARREIEAFLQSLNEAYDAIVKLLEAASSSGQAKAARRLVSGLEGTPVSPRSRDVNTKDDRTDVFGIPYKPPERDDAIAHYQRRSMHKLHVAEWHRAEFERLEGELTTTDFFDFDTERFLPAQAHADGALIQLAAGFDAFACAVAHHYGLENPDRASLWETKWVARLVEAPSTICGRSSSPSPRIPASLG